MSEQRFFVVDFRKEWTRKPYLTFWGPDSAGYCWSLPMAGRYTAAELDASVGCYAWWMYSDRLKAAQRALLELRRSGASS